MRCLLVKQALDQEFTWGTDTVRFGAAQYISEAAMRGQMQGKLVVGASNRGQKCIFHTLIAVFWIQCKQQRPGAALNACHAVQQPVPAGATASMVLHSCFCILHSS